MDYFVAKFQDDLSDSVCAFKAAQLFVPWKVREMMPTCSAVDMLKSFPFLNNAAVLQNLKSELSSYVANVADVCPDFDILLWWQNHMTDLPHWSSVVKDVVLVQPSSAAAERVFSILQLSFGPQQDRSLQDYVQSSIMLQYNKR